MGSIKNPSRSILEKSDGVDQLIVFGTRLKGRQHDPVPSSTFIGRKAMIDSFREGVFRSVNFSNGLKKEKLIIVLDDDFFNRASTITIRVDKTRNLYF